MLFLDALLEYLSQYFNWRINKFERGFVTFKLSFSIFFTLFLNFEKYSPLMKVGCKLGYYAVTSIIFIISSVSLIINPNRIV